MAADVVDYPLTDLVVGAAAAVVDPLTTGLAGVQGLASAQAETVAAVEAVAVVDCHLPADHDDVQAEFDTDETD